MKLFSLQYSQKLPISQQEAWAFFSDPANLAAITPPWLNFKVTSELPAEMYPGMIVRYLVHPFWGIPVGWVTEISHVQKPKYFVDEQRFGPYRFWHHQHHFCSIEGGVEMEDLVNYGLPLGVAGWWFNRILVRQKLEEIFAYRRKVLAERFGPCL